MIIISSSIANLQRLICMMYRQTCLKAQMSTGLGENELSVTDYVVKANY